MKIITVAVFVLFLQISTVCGFENFDQAFGQMQHRYSLGHYKRVIAISPMALDLSSNSKQKFDVLYYKGLALHALQSFWQAEQVFAEASRLEGISEREKHQAVYNQIKSQYANKHFISALTNAEKYSKFKKNPTALQLNILLTAIESAIQLNQNSKAFELADKMVKSCGTESGWHYRGRIIQIQILCLLKDYKKAKEIINKVDIEKVPLPMRAEFLSWAGFCYEKSKKPEEAGRLYAAAYADNSSYYSGLAALRHGNMLKYDEKNYEQVATIYEKVLQCPAAHSKHKSQAIYKIAGIYKQHEKPDIAIYFLAQIDKIKDPSIYWQAKIYNMHGDLLYAKGDIELARTYFKTCLNLSPEKLDATRLYAKEILAQIGKKRVLPEKQ